MLNKHQIKAYKRLGISIDYGIKKKLPFYDDAEDLISIGAYVEGSDPQIDYAKKMINQINAFLRQNVDETVSVSVGVSRLKTLFEGSE